jgi:hypothetical protein
VNAEMWACVGTAVATVFLLVVPGAVYAWYVLDHWIGRGEHYPEA